MTDDLEITREFCRQIKTAFGPGVEITVRETNRKGEGG